MDSHRNSVRKNEFYLLGQVGSFANKRINLTEGQVLIGRDAEHCRILLSQSIVSALQAAIEVTSQNRVFIKDLSSKNSTFVNRVSVSECELRDGDVIGFGLGGMVSFLFRQEIAEQSSPHKWFKYKLSATSDNDDENAEHPANPHRASFG